MSGKIKMRLLKSMRFFKSEGAMEMLIFFNDN